MDALREVEMQKIPDTSSQNIEEEIGREWDQNVLSRAKELEEGLDRPYLSELTPLFISLIKDYSKGFHAIDVGCGLGFLTNTIKHNGFSVTGIDISKESINYAKEHFENIDFINTSIKKTGQEKYNEFDVCTANMVLHNSPNILDILLSIGNFLKPNGVFIFSIPNPYTWYEKHDIPYPETENIIKLPFKIRESEMHPSPFSYFHREVSEYIGAIARCNFEIINSYDLNRRDNGKPTILIFICRKPL